MTKYTMFFLVAGVLAGLLLTRRRRFLLSGWFWAGAAVAAVIFLPNLVWQMRHDFISLHFLHRIHVRDVGEGRAEGFLRDQFRICTNLAAAPLWIAGLLGFLWNRRYRLLAWMYIVPLALFVLGKGRGYYLAAAYPVLIAMGAIAGERLITRLSRRWQQLTVEAAFFTGVAAYGAFMCAIILPLSASGSLRDFALKNNGDLREELGWHELVQTVAGIRDSLPPEQRDQTGVFVANYGEQGAVEILGPAYHLPPPISWTNSAWLRGYPATTPSTLIVLGLSRNSADRLFSSCRLAGHNGNPYGVHNEESDDHPDIFVCGSPRKPWPEFWKNNLNFG